MISVIIPAYNVENYIDRCIESVVAQTYSDLEIIVINDGSTDGTYEKCLKWASKDERIKIINEENAGLSEARNAGLDAANGEYIGFVDSDDFCHPQLYELLYNALIETKSDISICDCVYYFDGDGLNNEKYDGWSFKMENEKPFDMLVKYNNTCPMGYVWNKLYKKNIIKKFEKNRLIEDLLLNTIIFSEVQNVVYIQERLYYYYQRRGSILHGKENVKLAEDYCYVMEYQIDLSRSEYKDLYLFVLGKNMNLITRRYVEFVKRKHYNMARFIEKEFGKLYREYRYDIRKTDNRLKIFMFRYFRPLYTLLMINRVN